MENRSHITADQLHNLKEDEECLQACSDLTEIVIEMQKKQNMLAIDVRNELADFHNKHSKNDRRKNTRMLLWASITGVAAAVVIILVLRAMMISSQPEIIPQGRDIQSCFIRRNRSLLEFRQPISLPYDF